MDSTPDHVAGEPLMGFAELRGNDDAFCEIIKAAVKVYEIGMESQSFSVTYNSPGSTFDAAAGFLQRLFSEPKDE